MDRQRGSGGSGGHVKVEVEGCVRMGGDVMQDWKQGQGQMRQSATRDKTYYPFTSAVPPGAHSPSCSK